MLLHPQAFLGIGASLERHLGSVQFAWLIGVLIVVGDVIYVAAAYLGAFVPVR
jgi:hypothetical protein